MKSAKMSAVFAGALVLILAGSALADPNDPNWISFISSSTTGALSNVMVKSSDNMGILVASEIAGMYVKGVNVEGERYQTLNIPNAGHTAEVGKPQVPAIRKFVEIPHYTNVTVEIFCSDYSEYMCYNVYPAQQPQADNDTNEPPFVIDQTTYSTNGFYPSSIAEVEAPVTIRGHRIIPLNLFPVQFNPVTRKLRGYSNIEVRINYDYPAQTEGVEARLESEKFEELCKTIILNYKVPTGYMARIGGFGMMAGITGAEYLIITDGSFSAQADTLAEWKRKKGYITEVVTTATTGATAALIKQYIQNAYNTWNPAPSYVLLLGDAGDIPTSAAGTDLYYFAVDGGDYLPDIFGGRLPVATEDEAETAVNKILGYEKNPPTAENWFDDVLVAWSTERQYWIDTSNMIKNYLQNNGYTVNDVAVNSGGTDDITTPAADNATTNIINAFNGGISIANHRDHGSPSGWSSPSFKINNIPQLNNGDELPVMFSMNCESGQFDGGSDCFGEALLKAQNAGVVGFIGATRESYTGYNDHMDRGFYDAIWPDFISPTQNALYELGAILTYGKINMLKNYGNGYSDNTTKIEFEIFHLLGDPEMTIRIEQPQNLTVIHTSEINTGISQNINVNVKAGGNPVNHARIGLYKAGEVETAGYTNVAGDATISVTATTAGTLYITVTEPGSIPYEGTITVTDVPATITLVPNSGAVGSDFTINGSNFFAGETVNFNFGGTALPSTTASGVGSFSVLRNVPAVPIGPANVTATGQTSGKKAVAVFTVAATADPYIYDQWNSSTWHLNPSPYNPTWNSPSIQLYDNASGTPVSSGNLKVGTPYRIDATIHNFSATPVNGTQVTFEWFGLSTGTNVQNLIVTITVNVPASPGTVVASTIWTPILTGHCCIRVNIYHPSDYDTSNNKSQENVDVHPVSSPAEIPFTVYNTTAEPAVVELELTQRDPCEPNLYPVWATKIERACPQILEPNEHQTAILEVNAPESAYTGQRRLLSVTARVNGEIIGGIEFEVVKGPPVRAHNPTPADEANDVPANVTFNWQSGVYVNWHDVYLGTDETAVREANNYSDEYKGSVTEPIYYPQGYLNFGHTYYWRIDEVNPSNPDSPWEGDVWGFTVEEGTAHTPYPSDGNTNVTGTSVTLSWLTGRFAAGVNGHDVYFGTAFYDVLNATTATPNIYKGRQSATYYNATGLSLYTPYYWRIDEVNMAGPPPYIWQGDVWSFTAGVIIDDFESYSDTNGLNMKWKTNYLPAISCPNSATYGGGASIALQTDGSNKFMQFTYDNNSTTKDWYSEVRYEYPAPYGNWTVGNSRILSISYKGAADNNADQIYDRMYVMIVDSAGNKTGGGYGEPVLHPDPNAQKNSNWQEWNIDISDLSYPSVNLNAVRYLIIGFGQRCHLNGSGNPGSDGTVMIDDVRLYGRRCLPDKAKPAADLNYDCIVDGEDVGMLADEWLLTGCCRSDLIKDYAVDFRDFAVLANMWLEEQLWP
jgi:hypothetical protein